MTPDGANPTATVTVGSNSLRVPVPEEWERLEPLPRVPFVAREPSGDWFRVNVTVAVDHADRGRSPEGAGAELAAQLPGGVLVDARGHVDNDNSYVLTVAHLANTQDVVTVQRQLSRGDVTLAVSYTCAVEQLPDWRERFDRWLDEVELARGQPDDGRQAIPGHG